MANLVRRKGAQGNVIQYCRRPEEETAEDKLGWLATADLKTESLTTLKPNSRADWLNSGSRGAWDSLLPLNDPGTKAATERSKERSIFKLFSLGIASNRDEWAYDYSKPELIEKIKYFQEEFNSERSRIKAGLALSENRSIKWSSELEAGLGRSNPMSFDQNALQKASYRPFVTKWYYHDDKIIHRFYQANRLVDLPPRPDDRVITFLSVSSDKELSTLATGNIFDLCFTKVGNGGSFGISRYRYAKSGERIDNITDWALNKFIKQYGKKGVTKDAIFAYVYGVLHDPVYRETYALNLKREFPRIPFYPDFAQWVAWGEALMAMHIGYEAVEPWPVQRTDTPNAKRAAGTHPKPALKSLPETGVVRVDEDTQIGGIPAEAWQYRLGNRSAIDWVLDQHKEKTPRDPTIREKFNTYRFADYKESMIDLLAKVVRVSVDTVAITEAMKGLDRSGWAAAE